MTSVSNYASFVCLVAVAAFDAIVPASHLDLSRFDLTFDEEFDDFRVSSAGPGTTWIAHTPWYGDFGAAEFVDPSDSFPFTVSNGVLRIEARKGSDGKWRSGLIASADPSGGGFSQKFGYFEMRALLPAGPGVWPAFWLVSVDRTRISAEIDVLEHYGAVPDMYEMALHLWNAEESAKNVTVSKRQAVASGSLSEAFHDYGVLVEPTWTIFYFDRKEVWRNPTLPEHCTPMLILADLALGSGWPIEDTPNPSYMYVKHIRAYSRAATAFAGP